MAIRIPWDIHEAVLLLDAYEQIKSGTVSRKDAVHELSLSLRKKAMLHDIKIDDVYRNENGISLQLNNMTYAATNGAQGLPNPNKLFFEVVHMKKERPEEYQRLLVEAKDMVSQNAKIESEFWTWLAPRVQSNELLSELYLIFPEIEGAALEKGILHAKLFETADLKIIAAVKEMVDSDKVFRFSHRRQLTKMTIGMKHYLDFLRENGSHFNVVTEETDVRDIHPVERTSPPISAASMDEAVHCKVDFNSNENYAHSLPAFLTYFGERFQVLSWPELYRQACKCLYEDYPSVFDSLADCHRECDKCIEVCTAEHAQNMDRPMSISDTLFVEGNIDSEALIHRLKQLMDLCAVDYENLEVEYVRSPQVSDDAAISAASPQIEPSETEDPVKVNRIAFIDWMRKNDTRTSVVFETLSALNAGSKIGNEAGIVNTNLLLIQNCKHISTIKDRLLNNQTFLKENRKQGNRYLLALSRYYDFRASQAGNLPVGEEVAKAENQWNVITFLKERGLEFADNTRKGGSLWIIGGRELKPYIDEIKEHGITFHFHAYGGNASSGRPAWWAKLSAAQRSSLEDELPKENGNCESSGQKQRYELILRDCFENGFRPGSAVDRGRLRNFYEERYGEEITDSIENVIALFERIGVLRDGRLYAKQVENDSHLLDDITREVISAFECGASCIYIEAIYERYQQSLSDEVQIYNADALKDALIARANGAFYSRYSYLGCYKRQPDMENDVLSFMYASPSPVSYEEIKEKLWYLPFDRIKNILVTTKSIVAVATGCYFYAPNLPISNSEKEDLVALIDAELDLHGHITEVDLAELISSKCPSVAINTDGFTSLGVRNALGYILREHFTFNGPIISKRGADLSVSEIYTQYCRSHEVLSVDDLKELASEINLPIRWEVVLEEMVRTSENELIRKDLVNFDVAAIDEVLDHICTSDYYSIKKINLFLHFPPMEVKWTDYLLENFVYCYSKKFTLLHASFSATACCGAIVRQHAGITTYRDLLVRVLTESTEWTDKKSALEYIVREGYQQRRIYSDIDNVIQEAKIRKEQIENQKRG